MIDLFEKNFGASHVVFSEAHGRVNLIGEHTDYNGGFVLPTSIPQATRVYLKPRVDRVVRIYSQNIADRDSSADLASYILGQEEVRRDWTDYIQGCTKILNDKGHRILGFDLAIESNIPMGSGLSSSAALEVSVLKALNKAFQLQLSDVVVAQYGQLVENNFVGARVGIMDPMAISLTTAGDALFIDTQSLKYERVPLPLDEVEFMVINSGVDHDNAGGDYNQRRSECEQACKILGISELRELGMNDLELLERLPDVQKRRTRHVITENDRVLKAVEAIKQKNMIDLGKLFNESHLSMRDDYNVSIRQIDTLVELVQNQTDFVYGARLTGGGFGGSIVAAVKKGHSRKVFEAIQHQYTAKEAATPTLLVPEMK